MPTLRPTPRPIPKHCERWRLEAVQASQRAAELLAKAELVVAVRRAVETAPCVGTRRLWQLVAHAQHPWTHPRPTPTPAPGAVVIQRLFVGLTVTFAAAAQTVAASALTAVAALSGVVGLALQALRQGPAPTLIPIPLIPRWYRKRLWRRDRRPVGWRRLLGGRGCGWIVNSAAVSEASSGLREKEEEKAEVENPTPTPPVPDIASATAPASEKADPATDSIEGGGEQSEGEGGRRQVGEGAEDSGETDIGACGVLERLGAEVAEGLRCDDDILTAFFFPL